jgi:hypothetical protein
VLVEHHSEHSWNMARSKLDHMQVRESVHNYGTGQVRGHQDYD